MWPRRNSNQSRKVTRELAGQTIARRIVLLLKHIFVFWLGSDGSRSALMRINDSAAVQNMRTVSHKASYYLISAAAVFAVMCLLWTTGMTLLLSIMTTVLCVLAIVRNLDYAFIAAIHEPEVGETI